MADFLLLLGVFFPHCQYCSESSRIAQAVKSWLDSQPVGKQVTGATISILIFLINTVFQGICVSFSYCICKGMNANAERYLQVT